QHKWENPTALSPLYRNYSRYRSVAYWLNKGHSLLRCSGSIRCSIRCETIRASKNSSPRPRRTMRSDEVAARETKTLAVLSAHRLNVQLRNYSRAGIRLELCGERTNDAFLGLLSTIGS